jgi:hypothetical protein
LNTSTRLRHWKNARQKITQSSDTAHKIQTALAFWQMAPMEKTQIVVDDPATWPGPWEMIRNNVYCVNSHSVGLAYTLILACPATFQNLTVDLINDTQHQIQQLVVNWQDWYLNHGHVDKKLKSSLQQIYTSSQWCWDQKKWKRC